MFQGHIHRIMHQIFSVRLFFSSLCILSACATHTNKILMLTMGYYSTMYNKILMLTGLLQHHFQAGLMAIFLVAMLVFIKPELQL